MEPTQLDEQQQQQQQQNSPIQNGHPNGHAVPQQKQSHDGLETVSVVAIKDDEEQSSLKALAHHLYSSSSSSSETDSSLDGANEGFINGSEHIPTPNMQPVGVDSPGLTTAPNATTTSISAVLDPSSPTTVSPTTPTPTSVSLMFRQRLHPSQLDATSRQTSSEASLLESSATPKQSGDVYSTAWASKDEGVVGEGKPQGTKIVIPDPSTLVSSTDSNSNPVSSIPNNSSSYSNHTPSSSRPTSTTIDTSLFSNRPAPASPALSRRVSGAPSTASSTHSSNSNSRPRSRSSTTRRPSMGASRASLRMSGVGSDARRQSLGNQLNQFDRSTAASSAPLGSLNKLNFSPSSSSTQQATTTTAPSTLSDSITSDPLPAPTITPTPTSMFSPLPQPSSTPPAPAPARIYIKVRDFGFPPTDERHLGLGADIPKANRVHRLNRKLGGPDRATARAAAALDPSSSSAAALTNENGRSRRTDSIGSMGSVDSSDADVEEEGEEDEGWGIGGLSGWGKGGSKGWDGFRLGMGRFSWNIKSNHSNIRNGNEDSNKDKDKKSKGTSSNGIFPSRKDLDMNFMDSSSTSTSDDDEDEEQQRRGRRVADHDITEEFNDDDFDESLGDREEDGEYEEPQEPLYPGLYRALYAFEPEGLAEMELDENQIVRVVGRGGGIGWAVVVDERGNNGDEVEGKVQVKHALVPEGYLEAVRLDWEDEEEEGLEVLENEDGDGDGDTVVVKAGDA